MVMSSSRNRWSRVRAYSRSFSATLPESASSSLRITTVSAALRPRSSAIKVPTLAQPGTAPVAAGGCDPVLVDERVEDAGGELVDAEIPRRRPGVAERLDGVHRRTFLAATGLDDAGSLNGVVSP